MVRHVRFEPSPAWHIDVEPAASTIGFQAACGADPHGRVSFSHPGRLGPGPVCDACLRRIRADLCAEPADDAPRRAPL